MILKRLFSRRPPEPVPVAPGPAERRRACKEIIDLDELARIARDDTDAGVRDLALARLRRLLSGELPEAPALAIRLAWLEQAPDVLVAQIAAEAREPRLRQAAVARLDDPQRLAERAVADPSPDVRWAAIQRLEDAGALAWVVKHVGKRDSRVYREARRRHREAQERAEAPRRLRAQCESLCESAELLGRLGNWRQDAARLEILERQWSILSGEPPPGLQARFDRARAAFRSAYDAWRAAHREQIAQEEAAARRRAEAEQLIAALTPLARHEDGGGLRAELERIQAAWSALGEMPADLSRRYEAALEAARARLEQLRQRIHREQRLAALQGQAEAWLGGSRPLPEAEVRAWRKEGGRLARLEEDAATRAFHELEERLKGRLEHQRERAEHKLRRLDARLTELERALADGALKQATALDQSIEADLETIRASGLPKADWGDSAAHLRRLRPQLRELQRWRKWGTDQHREDLCQAMEALQQSDLPPAAIHGRMQELQQEWRSLGRAGSPINPALRERFQVATDRARTRCAPYLERQAAIWQANLEEREALLDELDEFLHQVDWERVSWKKMNQAARETRQRWARIGPVAPREHRRLERSFHQAMRGLDKHLAAERARNREYRLSLITRAEALAEAPDLEAAIEEIKRLQRAWQVTVAGKRRQENALWERFRAACDQVFARRGERERARREADERQIQALEALCGELEDLKKKDLPSADLERRLHDLEERWRDTRAGHLPRQAAARLSTCWADSVRRVQGRIAERLLSERRGRLAPLGEAHDLCSELEARVETAAGIDPAPWEERFAGLDEAAAQALSGRFRAALEAARSGPARDAWLQSLEGGRKTREQLCLHLEILAGVDSPPACREDRLAFQVERLADRLGQGAEAAPQDQALDLERRWYLAGAAPSKAVTALEERFRNALGRLWA